jgi:hypothetical protein
MDKSAFAVLALVITPAFAAQAQEPWRTATQQCDQYAESTFCRGKAGCPNWQWLSACTVQQSFREITPETQGRLEQCVAMVEAARARGGPRAACALCGDPVASVMSCMGARS